MSLYSSFVTVFPPEHMLSAALCRQTHLESVPAERAARGASVWEKEAGSAFSDGTRVGGRPRSGRGTREFPIWVHPVLRAEG